MLATAFGGRHLQKSSFDGSIPRTPVRRDHGSRVQADRNRPAARLRKEGDTTMRFMIIVRASRAIIPYLLERWLGLNGDTASGSAPC